MASMLDAFQLHPEDRLHLRTHRARSVVLTSQELVEIRAAQRTFEGAYMRTALSQFSFALVVLRIFTSEFYPIGALFACYGAAVLLVAIYRRYEGNRQFFDSEEEVEQTVPLEAIDEEEEGGEPHSGGGTGVGGGTGRGGSLRGQGPSRGRGGSTAGSSMHSLSRRNTVVVVKKKFRTSGNSVALLVVLSLVCYVALMVLLFELKE